MILQVISVFATENLHYRRAFEKFLKHYGKRYATSSEE